MDLTLTDVAGKTHERLHREELPGKSSRRRGSHHCHHTAGSSKKKYHTSALSNTHSDREIASADLDVGPHATAAAHAKGWQQNNRSPSNLIVITPGRDVSREGDSAAMELLFTNSQESEDGDDAHLHDRVTKKNRNKRKGRRVEPSMTHDRSIFDEVVAAPHAGAKHTGIESPTSSLKHTDNKGPEERHDRHSSRRAHANRKAVPAASSMPSLSSQPAETGLDGNNARTSAAALKARAKVLTERVQEVVSGTVRLPVLWADALPFWVAVFNDLLLFHNATKSSAGASQLPAYSAVSLLRADLARAKDLLIEVALKKDWVWCRGRCAKVYEEGVVIDAVMMASGVEEVTESIPPAYVPPGASPAVPKDGMKQHDQFESKDAAQVTLLSSEYEARDESLPVLQRIIPLWRRRGGAAKTIHDLMLFLENRLEVLERRLLDSVEGTALAVVGAPNGTGVNGEQRSTLSPGIEQAYASFMTYVLLSDLFTSPNSAFTCRAERISFAFNQQTPRVHDTYVVEEKGKFFYDKLLLRSANMFEGLRLSTPTAASWHGNPMERERCSITVHIDYLRLQPPALLDSLALFVPFAHENDATKGAATRSDHRQAVAESHSARMFVLQILNAAVDPTPAGPRLLSLAMASLHATREALKDRLAMASVAVALARALANRHGELSGWTAEDYLLSALLSHYEQYRLLRLNQQPFLKHKACYAAKLRDLREGPRSAKTCGADVAQLKEQLKRLHSCSAELERYMLVVMLLLWQAVLLLQGEPAVALAQQQNNSEPAHQSGTLRRLSASGSERPWLTLLENDGSGQEAIPVHAAIGKRHQIRDLHIFTSFRSLKTSNTLASPTMTDYARSCIVPNGSEPPHAQEEAPIGGAPDALFDTTPLPLFLKKAAYGCLSEDSPIFGVRSGVTPSVGVSLASATPLRLRLFHVDHDEEVSYAEGEEVLHYTAVLEGIERATMPGLSGPPVNPRAASFPNPPLEVFEKVTERIWVQIVVFARSQGDSAPLFIGCTLPRPLTAARVGFFDESFAIRTGWQPLEILLHVVAVSEGPLKGRVVASLRLRPGLAPRYSVYAVQPPVAFGFGNRVVAVGPNEGMPGTLACSTTWTNAQGLSMPQIETLFLSGAADPTNPELVPLLRTLHCYYAEEEKEEGKEENRNRGKHSAVLSEHESRIGTGKMGPAANARGTTPSLLPGIERIPLLRWRWQIRTGKSAVQNRFEARVLAHPIALSMQEQQTILQHAQVKRQTMPCEQQPYSNEEAQPNESRASLERMDFSPRAKEAVRKRWQDQLRAKALTSVVVLPKTDEELLQEVVRFPMLGPSTPFDWKPRSRLNPRRAVLVKSETIHSDGSGALSAEGQIVVHLVKAHRLPVRVDGTPLNAFVQAAFVHANACSRCERGSAPAWFQSLGLVFEPPDFDEATLRLITDEIVVSVYDSVLIRLTPRAAIPLYAKGQEIHARSERRLLATLRVPFELLHRAAAVGRLEGVFPLHVPQWIAGYASNAASSEQGPTLQLSLALQPPPRWTEPPPWEVRILPFQTPPLLYAAYAACLAWVRNATARGNGHRASTPQKVMAFVQGASNGMLRLACQYLRPRGGPPPKEVTNAGEAIRFVALLPVSTEEGVGVGEAVWQTNDELLVHGARNDLSRALLLTHFLRYFTEGDVATFVVLGAGEAGRQTAMVLQSFDGKRWHLIEPCTGRIIGLGQPFGSDFKNVSMLLSDDQMWANVQHSGLPHLMAWDRSNPAHWLPCFDSSRNPSLAESLSALSSLQQEVLPFSLSNPLKAKHLETKLREGLKPALRMWRDQRPPVFYRSVEAVLRELLRMAEEEFCTGASARGATVAMGARSRLSEFFRAPIDVVSAEPAASPSPKFYRGEGGSDDVLRPNHPSLGRRVESETDSPTPGSRGGPSRLRLVGSPVNEAYDASDADFNRIFKKVFDTAAHEVGGNDVSFAIGTYVKSYTGEVFSMWVFLLAICRDATSER